MAYGNCSTVAAAVGAAVASADFMSRVCMN